MAGRSARSASASPHSGALDRLALGLIGDAKSVGSGVSELRVDYGRGYRVYFKQQGRQVVVLLAGGDKRTQDKDIRRALALARDL